MEKILVIEDDVELSGNIALILKMEGYLVEVASNGREGLALLERNRPDLILCDILMPELDGYALHRQVKAMPGLAGIPFIFISALNEPSQLRKGMQSGADDYLCKPFTAEELVASVAVRLRRFAAFTAAKEKQAISEVQLQALRRVSRREMEILSRVAFGETTRDIGERFHISPKTVEVHRSRLMKKLGAANAVQLVGWAKLAEQALRNQLIGPPGEDGFPGNEEETHGNRANQV